MNTSKIEFRNIEGGDIVKCAELFALVFSSEPWDEGWNLELAMRRLSHFYESRGFIGLIAVQHDTEQKNIAGSLAESCVLGFVLGNTEPFYFGDMYYLREMCIQPVSHCKGVGTHLMAVLERDLRERGVHSIYLTTKRDIPAASFYQNKGFTYIENMGFYAKRIGMEQ